MFSKVYNFILGVETRVEHDVEAIISDFTSTVTKLEDAAEAKLAEATHLFKQSQELKVASDAADAAAARATIVAAKIKELVA